MKPEIWLAFIAATALLTLIPGPSVLLIISQAITRGKKVALMCIAGDVLAVMVQMTLCLLGVGAILAASATLFAMVKWAGIGYMAYLGYRQIADARKGAISHETTTRNQGTGFGVGFLTGVLNPKGIIFNVAFLTQFMDPTGNTFVQFSILVVTSTIVVSTILAGYALLATRARQTFQSRKSQKIFGYTGGSFLIGGSVLMAATR